MPIVVDHIPFDIKNLSYQPLSPDTWHDLETLFGEHGLQNGCWCMFWRTTRKKYHRNYGDNNRLDFKRLVESGKTMGFLAFLRDKPIAWCSISPRDEFPALVRSTTLKSIDELRVWSLTCFFVSKPYRGLGFTSCLIQNAIEFTRQHGGQIVEAYPLGNNIYRQLPYERFMGIKSTFEKLGFRVVVQRSERRPILRYYIEQVFQD